MKRAPRQGRTLAALIALAVGTTMVIGGVAGAKDTPRKKATREAIQVANVRTTQAQEEARAPEYAGTVDGTDAYIDVVVRGKDVSIYICDGAGLITWPEGKIKKDGSFLAESASGAKVSGTITDALASGSVTLADGSEHAFSAQLATSPAGLYQHRAGTDSTGENVLAATIVLADGSQRGGQVRVVGGLCERIKASALAYLTEAQNATDFDEHQSSMDGFHRQTANYINHGCSSTNGPIT